MPHIQAPLPDLADHVVQAPGIQLLPADWPGSFAAVVLESCILPELFPSRQGSAPWRHSETIGESEQLLTAGADTDEERRGDCRPLKMRYILTISIVCKQIYMNKKGQYVYYN